jgi:adenylate cyclase, class 2
MTLEVEFKARIDSTEIMRKRILSIGGVFSEKREEADYYYNSPTRDFAVTGEALRVRVEDDIARITYKGALLGGRAKSRVEEETSVGEPETMKRILGSLGFIPVGVVKKSRSYFAVSDTTVTIDQVEGLGSFIEIEQIGENRELIEKQLLVIAEKLEIHEFEQRSYLALILGTGD